MLAADCIDCLPKSKGPASEVRSEADGLWSLLIDQLERRRSWVAPVQIGDVNIPA
jgi:hypothetical protein